MQNDPITNANIFSYDYEREARMKFIASIPIPKRYKNKEVAPGVPARGVWGQDVSGGDRRSVKAQLTGRGDLRVAWWNICCWAQQKFCRDKSLEMAIYRFHRTHQGLTLGWLEYQADRDELAACMQPKGYIMAIREYCTAKAALLRQA